MPTIDRQVSASADDAVEWGNGSFDNAHSQNRMSPNSNPGSSGYSCSGQRFQNITVPQGSTITAAYMEWYIYHDDYDFPNGDIYGNDVDDASDFNDEQDVINRVRTAASTPWEAGAVGQGVGWYGSGESLVAVVQEIVDRGSWSSGNAMVFLAIADVETSGALIGYAYDGSAVNAPKLHIEYTTGGITHYGVAILSGVGTLAGIGVSVLTGLATLAGMGTLSALASLVKTGAATLSGSGLLTAIAGVLKLGVTTLSGIGSITASAVNILSGKATLTGVGNLAGIGTIVDGITHYASALLSGSGILAAKGMGIFTGNAILIGQGILVGIGSIHKKHILPVVPPPQFGAALTYKVPGRRGSIFEWARKSRRL